MDIRQVFKEISEEILPIIKRYREKIKELEIRTKEDNTLLTDADIEVQKTIIKIIQKNDKSCRIISEEDVEDESFLGDGKYTWIIDPIDGTKEFVSSQGKEFCTAICVLNDIEPIGAMVLLPELGCNNQAILIEGVLEGRQIYINNSKINIVDQENEIPKRISATRSSDSSPHVFEAEVLKLDCQLKTRTTSQTIDLLRVAMDLSIYTELTLSRFDLFYRKQQKIWDGAPGIIFNHIAGQFSVDGQGKNILPFSRDLLKQRTPILSETIVGKEEHASWLLRRINN